MTATIVKTVESNEAKEQQTVESHETVEQQDVEINGTEEDQMIESNEAEEQQANESHDAKEQPLSSAKAAGPVLPDWLNEEYFVDVLEEHVEDFKAIQHFEAALTGGGGENYASIMVRVKVKVELKDGSTKDVAYMIKTIPQGEQGAMMVNMMGLFPKEIAMYGQLLPEFEQMYRDVGKTVRFGPKFFEFKKNPGEYVLLEDIGPNGYKNANRLEGLDEQHILTVLKIVAELHAASAVRCEAFGEYEDQFMDSIFSEKHRPMLEMMGKTYQTTLFECLSARPNTAKYVEKLKTFQENMVSMMIEANNIDLNEFNVVIHGDLWANNVMFRYNSESGELEDTILVDFQMSRYASPVVDLLYFLLSSTKLELKVACFDKFVKFYHEQLTENLRLLNYSKKIPTLRDFHIQILKRGVLAFTFVTGIMATVLMNPCEDANIENFMNEGEGSQNFQKQMFNNPRFLKHAEVVLEWLDLRGLLEF